MNDYDQVLYDSGLIAQGCWDEMDLYAKNAILKAFDLIVKQEREEIVQAIRARGG